MHNTAFIVCHAAQHGGLGLTDFFDSSTGAAYKEMDRPRRAAGKDWLYDLALKANRNRHLIDQEASTLARQRVLVVGVEVPSRLGALRAITERLSDSRHDVVVATVGMGPKGKFENVADAIAAAPDPLESYDWLMITDDDVELSPRFTDLYLGAASLTKLVVSQPAHRFRSYASYDITRRKLGALVRQTQFVEIGPLTIVHRVAFSQLIPFPVSRWAWGIDLIWADICKRNDWRMGIVDALPIRHLRPVGEHYGADAAILEGRGLLMRHAISTPRAQLLAPGRELVSSHSAAD